jgi:ComEC/Rec2-related protein
VTHKIKQDLVFVYESVMNRLFVVATLSLLIGIYLGHLGIIFSYSTLILIPCFLIFLFVLNAKKYRIIVLLFVIILFSVLGNAVFKHYTQRILCKSQLVDFFHHNEVDGLTGIVVGDSTWKKVNASNDVTKLTFPMKLDGAILSSGDVVDVSGKINVVWLMGRYDTDNMPAYGNRLKLGGMYCRTNSVDRGVDKYIFKITACSWKSEELEKNVFSSGILLPIHRYKLFCFNLRKTTLKIFDMGLENSPNISSILKSIIAGRRVFLSQQFKENLIRTGTIHIIAVSGLHAGIVAGIIIAMLKLFGCPRYRWFYILAPILITYTLYTGARPSSIRACLMLLIFYFSNVINRKSDVLSTVAISAFVILIINPVELFDLGFIFSFATVLGLILLFPPVYGFFERKPRFNPIDFVPEPPPEKNFLSKVITFVKVMFVVSLVAWFVSMPLTIYFFGRVVFVAPLVNVLVVPLTFCLILTGIISLSSAILYAGLPFYINKISIIFASALEYIIDYASGFKFVTIENVDINNMEFLLYIPMIAVVLFYQVYKFRKQNEINELWNCRAEINENFH